MAKELHRGRRGRRMANTSQGKCFPFSVLHTDTQESV